MPRSQVTLLIEQFKNLNPVEQAVFLDQVDPQPEPGPAAKQTRKKRGPSKKAQSLSTAIASSREAKAEASQPGDVLCTAKVPGLDVVCDETADKLIHDPNGGYGGYHPFSSTAPVAAKKSRQKGAGERSTPNTDVPLASVGTAASTSGD